MWNPFQVPHSSERVQRYELFPNCANISHISFHYLCFSLPSIRYNKSLKTLTNIMWLPLLSVFMPLKYRQFIFIPHQPISAPAGVERSVIFREFQKRPHHLTFLPETPLFTGGSESEVFAKHLTQHLTQQVTFSPQTLAFIIFLEVMCSRKE